MVVQTKTYATLVLILPRLIFGKKRSERTIISLQNLFSDVKTTFRHTSCNVCLVAIPEVFAQTQGSDQWRLILSVLSHSSLRKLTRKLVLFNLTPQLKQASQHA